MWHADDITAPSSLSDSFHIRCMQHISTHVSIFIVTSIPVSSVDLISHEFVLLKPQLLPRLSISLANRALEEMAVGNNLLLWHDSQALKHTAVERDSISRGLLSSFSLSELECIFRAQCHQQ